MKEQEITLKTSSNGRARRKGTLPLKEAHEAVGASIDAAIEATAKASREIGKRLKACATKNAPSCAEGDMANRHNESDRQMVSGAQEGEGVVVPQISQSPSDVRALADLIAALGRNAAESKQFMAAKDALLRQRGEIERLKSDLLSKERDLLRLSAQNQILLDFATKVSQMKATLKTRTKSEEHGRSEIDEARDMARQAIKSIKLAEQGTDGVPRAASGKKVMDAFVDCGLVNDLDTFTAGWREAEASWGIKGARK